MNDSTGMCIPRKLRRQTEALQVANLRVLHISGPKYFPAFVSENQRRN